MSLIRFSVLLFFVASLVGCKVNHLVSTTPKNYTVEAANEAGQDESILAMVGPYKSKLDAEMNQVIGTLAQDLERGRPESGLGNLVADALQAKMEEITGQDIAFTVANSGGLRIPNLPKGPVTKAQIFELLPFDNIMVYLELDAEVLTTLLNHMAKSGGWPNSKGLRYTIVNDVADKVMIKGEAIDPSKTYKVAMPDYVANGGSGSFFLRNEKQKSANKYMRDLVIEYIQGNKGPVEIVLDGRIEILN